MFLKEAIRIADDLIEKSNSIDSDLFWITTNSLFDTNEKFDIVNATIYNGSTGIVLFFLELYYVTGDNKYKEVFIKGLTWSKKHQSQSSEINYSFYTGKLSLTYTLTRAHIIFNDNKYLDDALESAKDVDVFLNHDLAELIGGISGTLLILLYLHNRSKKDWVLQKINLFVNELIKRIQFDKVGIYWDRNETMIKPLTGFSHGVSGIAFVFLHLSKYFNNPCFRWIAQKAFEYEDQFYSHELNNWSDLRKGMYIKADVAKFHLAVENGNYEFFENHSYMSAWCHGAPGIGLSRLMLFELTMEKRNWRKVEKVINHILTKDNSNNSASICHGVIGDIELLLEVYLLNNESNLLEQAKSKAKEVLMHKEKIGYFISGVPNGLRDSGLFLGDAGVAYNFLRLHDPLKTPSILMLKFDLESTERIRLDINYSDINRRILSTRFRRSILIIEYLFPFELNKFLKKKFFSKIYIESWIAFVQNEILVNFFEGKEQLCDIFELERKKMNLDFEIKSYAYLYSKRMYQIEKNRRFLSSEQLLNTEISLSTNLVLSNSRWNWTSSLNILENLITDSDIFNLVFLPNEYGVDEIIINDFQKIIFEIFSEKKTIADGISESFEYIEEDVEHLQKKVKDLVFEQIKEALRSGFLLIEETC